MDPDTEEVMKQVESLRNEVGQLREIVRMLLEIIMEHEGEDEESLPPGFTPYMDGGRITGEDYRDLGM
ncbi:MAG: hypothetical protein KAS77_08325 [Thermoplasmata archaeon]|nr:hypothetical protein [Thermoplasmata archaeon]